MTTKEKIQSMGGKFFSVEFIKRNGETRVMLCKVGVTKYLKGGKRTVGNDVQVVFDMHKMQYRSFRYDSVIRINKQWI
tara:strand:+ start:972 stop:1205 length:234 start_codon:yes stop_codon:yes gene_type:complete